MEDCIAIIPTLILCGWRLHLSGRPLVDSPSGRVRAGAICDATGDRQKPWFQGAVDPQMRRLPGQDKEGRLKRILGRVRVAEDRPGRPEN